MPSASLIPADPTLLLTGAGMVPFKPIFLGKAKVDYRRAASVQKCVRTTDIDIIGRTGRHLTFFEMLGNFSFGDYYKKEAISWAWDFLTNVLQLDKSKLWVSVFQDDDEAAAIWTQEVGLAPKRVVRLGEKDNFWSAGPTGPCGPSSEILYDQGPEKGCGRPTCGVGCDCDRYLEVWNLVFMQYNRDEHGKLTPLPKKNIDTGMGLERIASILQQVPSNFEIDLIKPLLAEVTTITGKQYGEQPDADVSLRIIVDHIRAVTFLIADGVLPGNEGRGYILRRLVRRAIRHGRLLGVENPFLGRLIKKVVALMSNPYQELAVNEKFILAIAEKEEEKFSQTLKQGLAILASELEALKSKEVKVLPGTVAFKLYDTYGFPLELTQEIAAEQGLTVDLTTFNSLMAEQKQRAKQKAAGVHAELYVGTVYHQIKEQFGATEFVGYEKDALETEVVAISSGDHWQNEAEAPSEVELYLKKTPFYPEKGGQVGDSGVVEAATGLAEVITTIQPIADLIVHRVQLKKGKIKIGAKVKAQVDTERRLAIARNHTATHLLHWALRLVLGTHVKQAGSLVEAERLRFDFTHHQPLTEAEVKKVEQLVNARILQSHPVRAYETTFNYAQEVGALAFFGEKYCKFVRLVEVGDFSKELCGGIHVHNSGEINLFKIVSETGIGSNTRRIEAVTGAYLRRYVEQQEEKVKALAKLLEVEPAKVEEALSSLLKQFKQLKEELAKLKTEKLKLVLQELKGKGKEVNGRKLFIDAVAKLDMNDLLYLADQLRSLARDTVVVLASEKDGRVMLLAAGTQAAVKSGFNAHKVIKELAPLVAGGGGGRPDLAQAGGKSPEGIPKLLKKAKMMLE